MSVRRLRQEFRSRRARVAAIFFAAGLLVLGAGFLLRKTLIGWTAERVLAAALGVEGDVAIVGLGPEFAEASFRGRVPKVSLSHVHLKWRVKRWWPLDVTALVRAQEEALPLGSARAIGFILEGEAAFRGSRLVSAEAQARSRAVDTGRTSFSKAEAVLSLGPKGLNARLSAHSPLGPVEARLEGIEPDLSLGFAGRGHFSALVPGAGAKGKWDAKFGGGFVEGRAVLSDVGLSGSVFPPWIAGPRFTVTIDKRADGAKITAELPAGKWAGLTTSAPLPIELDAAGAGVEFHGAARGSPWATAEGLRVGAVEAKGRWTAEAVELSARAIGVDAPGVLFPVEVSLRAEGPPDRVRLSAEVKDLLQDVWLSAKGEWRSDRGLDVAWDREFSFGGGFDPTNLTPLVEGLKPRSGRLRIRGRARSPIGGTLRLSGGVVFSALTFDYEGMPCEGLSGAIDLDRLYPPRLARRAEIRAASFGSVVPFKEVEVDLLPAGERVRVEKLTAHWGDGRINAEPFVVTLVPPTFATQVSVEHVNAESLLKDAAAGQLKATGLLVGTVPLEYRDGFLRITNGSLSAKKGWIQYKDPALAGVTERINYLDQLEELLARGQQALAFKALDNFLFDELKLELTRHPDTKLAAQLTLAGHNPDLANGMPFQFHIGLSGQLESAMKESFLKGLMRPEAFTEYLKKK